jgi:hypothetical protein
MAAGIQKNRFGPFWPLGSIVVVTPGTPVNMMSLVDPSLINAPSQLVPSGLWRWGRAMPPAWRAGR